MTQKEVFVQHFVIPNAAVQEALSARPAVDPSLLSPIEAINANQVSNPLGETPATDQQNGARFGRLGRVASSIAAVTLTGYLLFGGEKEAEAAPQESVAAQTAPQSPQETNTFIQNLPHLLTGAALISSAFIATRGWKKQGQQNRDNRLSAALQAIPGESTGETRLSKLANLREFANDKDYALKIFDAVVTSLRGRRGSIEKIRWVYQEEVEKVQREHKDDPELEALLARCKAKYEFDLTDRRNADREALKLFFKTRPAAQKQLKRPSRIKRLVGADELYELDQDTDTPVSNEKPRIDARGINLDSMRGIKRCSFRDADLTGAGLQECQFMNVIFRNARISEAQFEGSTLERCSLRGTDARAAYWYGATIERCVIDKHTVFGNLPDEHPDARHGNLKPSNPDEYRGNPHVVLKDLRPKGMSKDDMIKQIKDWQRNGLVLLEGSTPEYFLTAADGPNPSPAPQAAA